MFHQFVGLSVLRSQKPHESSIPSMRILRRFCQCLLARGSIRPFSLTPQSFSSPRRPRRWFRNFLVVTALSSISAAGLLYTSGYFRNLLSDVYPPSKPILDQIGSFVGGWYAEKPSSRQNNRLDDKSALPYLSEPKVTWHDPCSETLPTHDESLKQHSDLDMPTLEEVQQMTKEKEFAVPAATTIDIRDRVTKATQVVQEARATLGQLESATKAYIEALREANKVTDAGKERDRKWEQVAKLAAQKDKVQDKSNRIVDQATGELDMLRASIGQWKSNRDHSLDQAILPDCISAYGDLQYSLSGAIFEVRRLQNEVSMLMRYRDLVSHTHENLQKDLDSIRDETDLNRVQKDGCMLTVGELNSLIVVAHNRIDHLQSMLAEAETSEKARLNSALSAQRRADEELIAECVRRELDRERNKHELERYKWAQQSEEATERELRAALARHSDHLSHMLRIKEEEKEHQFTYRVREAIAQEKIAFEAALSGWIQRMKAIEDVVDGRAELDRIAKETQALWIACEALACSLTSSHPSVGEKHVSSAANVTGPLTDFVEAVKEAAATGNHPFALTVLNQISPETTKNGVWTERGLKERFEKVNRVCRRVALVDETSGSLITYALSWLQSLLVFDLFSEKYAKHIPWLNQTESAILAGDSDVIGSDLGDLNAFSLLHSAKAALMEPSVDVESADVAGDDGIELAIRLMGQLRGQARMVASDWLDDARRYLETKQAAQILLAYAAARGMSNFEKRL